VTGQSSNRLVCRTSQGLDQRAFRVFCVIQLILSGHTKQINLGLTERPEAKPRPVRPQLADRLILSNVGCFQFFQFLPITGKGRSKLQRPRFARDHPANRTEDVDCPVENTGADSRSPKSRRISIAVDDQQIRPGSLIFVWYSCSPVTSIPVVQEFPVFRDTTVAAVSWPLRIWAFAQLFRYVDTLSEG
jgi:hypothetical protein